MCKYICVCVSVIVMKSKVFFLFVSFLYCSAPNVTFAHEEEEKFNIYIICKPPSAEKVETTRLKIIGQGIENRKTGDIIALACIGSFIKDTESPSCRTLRHVKIPAQSQEAYFIGEIYTLSMEREPTQNDFQKLVRKVNKSVKQFKKDKNQDTREKILALGAFTGGVAWGVHVISLAEMGIMVSAGAALLPFFGGVALTSGVLLLSRIPNAPNSGIISDAMANQDGWNWSVSPNKISNQRFKWIERYLE